MDNLRDLLFAMDHPNGTPPKLEIKLDVNKMVVVKNVVTKASAYSIENSPAACWGRASISIPGMQLWTLRSPSLAAGDLCSTPNG